MSNLRWQNVRPYQVVLPVCLLAQAALLMTRLDLLPVWGDEYFTLRAVSGSFGQTIGAYAADGINPPLHALLVKLWLLIRWPLEEAAAARLLSVLFALASTVAIDRLWLRSLGERVRLWFLLLWTLSPCLLLYARMARSYSLQVLVFAVVLRAAVELVREPRFIWRGLAFSVGSACLLYVHYLPGLALLLGVLSALAWRAMRGPRNEAVKTAAGVLALVAVVYAAWLPHLVGTVAHMMRAETPRVEGGLKSEIVRLGYWLFSFSLGETPPLWVLIAGMLLLPAILCLIWMGARTRPEWLGVLAVAALAGYAGAARWVAFVFTPGRLLFLLPFFLMLLALGLAQSGRTGWLAGGALVCLSGFSIGSYFNKTEFLNKGYLLPYEEIAEIVTAGSAGRPAALLADTWNTDPAPLIDAAPKDLKVILVSRESTEASVREQLASSRAQVVWYFRSTHDTSPGRVNRRLEQSLSEACLVRRHDFVPYSHRDRLMMEALGWQERPTHLVALLEAACPAFGAGPGGASPSTGKP
ncbi:MAG: hypothetical protein ACE141_15150 [Bryobacteraceae bacterium]